MQKEKRCTNTHTQRPRTRCLDPKKMRTGKHPKRQTENRNSKRRGIRSTQAKERRAEKQKEQRRWGRLIAKTYSRCPSYWKHTTLPHWGRDNPTTKVIHNDNITKYRERILLDAVISKTEHSVRMAPRTNLLSNAVDTKKHEEQTCTIKRDFISRNAAKRSSIWG